MSTPPKRSAMRGEGGAHALAVGHVAGEPQAADLLGRRLGGRLVEVEHGHRGALRRERLGRGAADAAAGAGDHRHLAGEGLGHRALQLGLLQAPVLDVEQVALGQRLEAADRLRIGDHLDGRLGQVGGDGGILRRGADAEQADARHQHQARHGVELGLDAADAGVLAREHRIVVGDVVGRPRCARRP